MKMAMTKKEKIIQDNMKEVIFGFAGDVRKGMYYIDNINFRCGIVETGVDENGRIEAEPTKEKTLTIKYIENK